MKLARVLGMTIVALAAACGETGSGPGGGTEILLTDSPFPFDRIERVDVHIVRIEATTSLDTMPGSNDWVTVVVPDRSVNLLDLQNGATLLLGAADIPAGQYRALRLVINTSLSSMTAVGGNALPVSWPVIGELSMYAYVEDPLPVSSSGGRIVIDFDVGRSFRAIGNGFVFLPYIRAVNDAATGQITGIITFGDTDGFLLSNAVVTVYQGGHGGEEGAVVAMGRTSLDGQFRIAFLSAGTYDLDIDAPYTVEGSIESCTSVAGVTVSAGGSTTVTRRLPSYDSSCLGRATPDSGGGVDTTIVSPGGPVDSVAISMNPPVLKVGDSAWAAAVLRDADGAILSNRAVTWSVSDSTKVTLYAGFGPYAHVKPTATGTVTLTATSEGKTGHVTFTIGAGTGGGGGGGGGGTGPVATVTMSPASLNPAVNDSVGVYALLYNTAGQSLSGRTVSFTSSDTTVIRIMGVFGQTAILRALKVGPAQIIASVEGKTGTVPVIVH